MAVLLSPVCGCAREPDVTGPAPTALKEIVGEYVRAIARGDGSHRTLELGEASATLKRYSQTALELPAGARVTEVEVTQVAYRGPGRSDILRTLIFATHFDTSSGSGIVDIVLTIRVKLDNGDLHEGTISLRPESAARFNRANPAGPESKWRVVPTAEPNPIDR